MRFNFLIVINLAAIFSLGSSILNFDQYLRDPLPDDCSVFVGETIKIFDNCNVSEKKPSIDFGRDALPYVCLLTLDVATEFCKLPDPIKQLEGMNRTKSVCPVDYSLNSSNLRTNIIKGVQYMSDEKNCIMVCEYDPKIFSVCQFIAFANKIIKEERVGENLNLMKKDEKQSQDLFKSDKTINLTVPGKINQDSKSASQTMPSIVPGQTLQNIVQNVTNEKFNNTKPVAKTNGESLNKKSSTAHLDLKIEVGNKKTNGFLKSNSNFKNINDKSEASKTVNEPVLKKDNENHNEEENENIKSQVFLTSENAGIPETQSPSLSENLYSSKNNQNNDMNKNNNNKNSNNNNNNNSEFLYDSVPKTPHDEAEDDDENNDEDLEKSGLQDPQPDREPQFAKSLNSKETYSSDNFFQAEDSHFSVYFLSTISIIIIGYVIYHNKKKIIAYALEGRRNRNGRRRPTSASYRKLDCNLEEAIASNPSNTSVTNVVY